MASTQKHILHVFSSLELGGAQRRFIAYVQGSQAKHRHSVYAMDGIYDALKLLPGIKAPNDGKQTIPKGNTLAAVKACRQYLKDQKPDLLVTYNWGATEWILANKYFPICPMIHIQDGFTADELSQEIHKRRLMRAFAYKSCAAVVVPSLSLEKQVRDNWGIKAEKLKFIPNGIDTERFKGPANQNFVRSLGLDSKKPIIGTVAGLRPEKNVGRLIEAFSEVEDSSPECQLVIVGEGIGMAALKMLAERVCRKGAVFFTGSLPHPEYILAAFDIFALSSDTEQMPLSVIEAMATGLPIVSTNVGDIAHMVAQENTEYIAGKDAKTLAKNLSALLQAPKTAREIGLANQKKATTDYQLEKMINRYDTLFEASFR